MSWKRGEGGGGEELFDEQGTNEEEANGTI